jgi:hypothetical protein
LVEHDWRKVRIENHKAAVGKGVGVVTPASHFVDLTSHIVAVTVATSGGLI